MSKKLAPTGEEKRLELHEVLAKVAEAATKAAGFLSEYFKAWEFSDQELMRKNLQYREPYFAELMEGFHCAMENAWALADENREAWYFVYGVPPVSRRNSDIRYVRRALETTSRVANRWLAAHPVQKDSIFISAVEYLIDKTPDRFWLWYALFLMPLFECIRHPWLALRANKREEEK